MFSHDIIKKILFEELDTHINQKELLKNIDKGIYPEYIKYMPIKTLEIHLKKIRKCVYIYESLARIMNRIQGYTLGKKQDSN